MRPPSSFYRDVSARLAFTMTVSYKKIRDVIFVVITTDHRRRKLIRDAIDWPSRQKWGMQPFLSQNPASMHRYMEGLASSITYIFYSFAVMEIRVADHYLTNALK